MGILAIIAALAGTGLYLISASYEQQVAELRKQLEQASQREAASAAAAKAAYMSAVETAVAQAKAQAQKAAAERAAAQRAAAEARARAERFAAERASAVPMSAQQLFDPAQALEGEGKGGEAVKLYVRAARSGSGKAALRLGEIYDKGIAGVSRDYAESLKWYNAARVLGEDVPMAKSR